MREASEEELFEIFLVHSAYGDDHRFKHHVLMSPHGFDYSFGKAFVFITIQYEFGSDNVLTDDNYLLIKDGLELISRARWKQLMDGKITHPLFINDTNVIRDWE